MKQDGEIKLSNDADKTDEANGMNKHISLSSEILKEEKVSLVDVSSILEEGPSVPIDFSLSSEFSCCLVSSAW